MFEAKQRCRHIVGQNEEIDYNKIMECNLTKLKLYSSTVVCIINVHISIHGRQCVLDSVNNTRQLCFAFDEH